MRGAMIHASRSWISVIMSEPLTRIGASPIVVVILTFRAIPSRLSCASPEEIS